MLVIEVLGPRLGFVLGSLLVKEVLTLGLGELVDFGPGKARKHLLGKLVRNGLACQAGWHISICFAQASEARRGVGGTHHQHVGGPRRP